MDQRDVPKYDTPEGQIGDTSFGFFQRGISNSGVFEQADLNFPIGHFYQIIANNIIHYEKL